MRFFEFRHECTVKDHLVSKSPAPLELPSKLRKQIVAKDVKDKLLTNKYSSVSNANINAPKPGIHQTFYAFQHTYDGICSIEEVSRQGLPFRICGFSREETI